MQENDPLTEELQNRIKELKKEGNKERTVEKDQIEKERLQRRYDEDKRLETMKTDLRQTF